jgi:hypothetical protein
MYRQVIAFDSDSFLEVASRITGEGEQLMVSIRGRKSNNETTVASVLMTPDQVNVFKAYLADWVPGKNLVQVTE